jgi:DnaJ-related protein SCJ1
MLPAGHDLRTEKLTVNDAKAWCAGEEECAGFEFDTSLCCASEHSMRKLRCPYSVYDKHEIHFKRYGVGQPNQDVDVVWEFYLKRNPSDPFFPPNYYEILGVGNNVSTPELKAAFRKLSLRWHPDKHSGVAAEKARAEFEKIREAYEILSDAFSRDAYDAVGDNPQELAGRLRDHVPVDKTPDLQGEKTIPLAAAYTGGTIAHYVDRMQVCRGCFDCFVAPHLCRNDGTKPIKWLQPDRCDACKACSSSEPSQYVCKRERVELILDIPKGVAQWHKVVFEKQGNQEAGKAVGGVVIWIKIGQHPLFRRRHDHLLVTASISVKEALTGVFKMRLIHLDRHTLDIECSHRRDVRHQLIGPGTRLVVRGGGMPRARGGYGHLIIQTVIGFPDELNNWGAVVSRCVDDWPVGGDTAAAGIHSATAAADQQRDFVLGVPDEPVLVPNSRDQRYYGHDVMFANTHPSIAVELFLDDGKGGRSQGTIGPSGQLQVKLLLTNALQEDKHLTLTLSHITMPPHIHCTDQGTYWRSAFRRPCRRHWRAEDKISGAYRPPTRAWGVLFGEGGAAAVVANCGAQAGHTSPARRRNHMRACRRVAGVGAGRSRAPHTVYHTGHPGMPHRQPHSLYEMTAFWQLI